MFWGEFAERASYYGMRTILFLYLTTQFGLSDAVAGSTYSYFKAACYFLPLLGGYLADRFFGKYWTIVGFSVPYVAGQLLIGFADQYTIFLALALLAAGSGVIKPNISALLGQTYDQKRPGNGALRANAFMWFYFSVNLGATISMALLPWVRDKYGYKAAFLIPAVADGAGPVHLRGRQEALRRRRRSDRRRRPPRRSGRCGGRCSRGSSASSS